MLNIGKIPADILKKIVFDKPHSLRKEVLVGPALGEDCAALELGNELTIVSSDPITGAAEDVGYLAVHINANDIAASGGEAVGIMVTVLLPKGATEQTLAEIMNGVYKAAEETGISVLGGHTEVTDAVTRPVVSATVIGKSVGKRFFKTGGATVGDSVVMTKYAALEGTAIVASAHKEKLEKLIGNELTEKAVGLKGFLSVIKDAKVACEHEITSMHDITEGGVLGACFELAKASSVGIDICLEDVPVLTETKAVCNALDIDLYKLVSSGSLLITTKNGYEVCRALLECGVNAAIIGTITESECSYSLGGKRFLLDEVASDEMYKV